MLLYIPDSTISNRKIEIRNIVTDEPLVDIKNKTYLTTVKITILFSLVKRQTKINSLELIDIRVHTNTTAILKVAV